MSAQIIGCPFCGATGDRWTGAGWGRGLCWACGGRCAVLSIDGKLYMFAKTAGLVYRDDKGRFAKVPVEALGEQARRNS
jgi:hypothetical protein